MAGEEPSGSSRDPWLLPAFLGVARLPINNLNFEHELFKQHRPVSEKAIDCLRTVFRREGCLRSQSQNWIDALVDPQILRSALGRNGLTESDICHEKEELPLLDLGSVNCLQGIHRILAATEVLNQNDQWWTVRLYSPETLPESTSLRIIEGSLNEQPYSDGQIFRKIRIYCKEGNKQDEDKWWARLTPTKRKDLKQLLKNPEFAKAFDDLVHMPGLWYPIQLGTLHRLLTLRCDEELLRYLRHVLRTWQGLLSDAGIAPEAVDRNTVEKLELLAPRTSKTDRDLIENYVGAKEVFQTVTHEPARQSILNALTSLPGLIPSLRSFFENLKYLEPCSKILKKLLGPKEKRSIYQSLSGAYFAPSRHVVEYAERRRRAACTGRGDETGLWLSYVQLWAFCLRHFPSMTQLVPRKELKKDKPPIRSNAALWHYLGDLAVNLGFRTEQAERFKQQDPYRSLAEQFLMSQTDALPDSRVIGRMTVVLKQADKAPAGAKVPQLTDEQYLSRDRRCGRPFDDDFMGDKDSLFLPLLYESEPGEGIDISPFFVKRDIFLSFLGNKYAKSSGHAITDGDFDGDTPMSEQVVGSSEPSEAQQLEKELENLKQQTLQLSSQLEAARGEARMLENERDGSRARERELESKHHEIDSNLSAKEQELLQEQQKNQRLLGQIEELRQDLAALEKERDATGVLDAHSSDPTALYHETDDSEDPALEQAFSHANEEVRRLNEKLEATTVDAENAQQAAKQEILDLKRMLSEQAAQLERLQAQANAEVHRSEQDTQQRINGIMQEGSAKINALVQELEERKRALHLKTFMSLVWGILKSRADAQKNALKQRLAEREMALVGTQLQRTPSPEASQVLRRLESKNKRLQRQLNVRQLQSGIFALLQESLESLSKGKEILGSFQIITPTAVISIDIPKPETRWRLTKDGTYYGTGTSEDDPSPTETCIKRVLDTMKEISEKEAWGIYIKHKKVMNWGTDYIKRAIEQYGTCVAGPEELLSSTKASSEPINEQLFGNDGSSAKLIGVNRSSRRVEFIFETLRHWFESVPQERKRSRYAIEVEEVESEGAELPHSGRHIEQSARLMIEEGNRSGDSESIGRERPSDDVGRFS